MKMHHAAVVASSFEHADRFYQGILGLKKIKCSTLPESLGERIFGIPKECPMVYYDNGQLAVEVFVIDSKKKDTTPYVHLCIEVEEREGFMAQCEAGGLMVNRVPKGDSHLVFVTDFDGNLFEIKQKNLTR